MVRFFSIRRIMKGTAIFMLCIAAFLLACQPRYAGKETQPGKKLLSGAVKAMGGEKNALGWTTRVEKGTLIQINPGWGTLKAECRHFVKKPDKLKIDNDFSAYDNPFYWTYYCNGDQAWGVVNLTVRQHPRITQNLREYLETVDWLAYYNAECDTFFHLSDVPDDSLFAGSSVQRVGCVHNGDTILFDLSRKTGFPVRQIENGGTKHTLFDDYRKTGDLKVPYHTTVFENGAKNTEYLWDEIEYNVEIDEAIFEENRPPAEGSAG